jgi:hypothetical protein
MIKFIKFEDTVRLGWLDYVRIGDKVETKRRVLKNVSESNINWFLIFEVVHQV